MAQQVNLDQIVSPQQVTNAAASYYTVPANQKAKILKFTATNTDTVARTLIVWLGTAASNGFRICDLVTIPPNTRGVDIIEAMGHVLNSGDQIWAQADANTAITIMVSGALLT